MSSEYTRYLSSIEDVVEDARNGKMVILVDDEDRENEGDLYIPAQFATPEAVNFMAKHGRGLICLTLTRQRCEALHLPLMVGDTDTHHGTNFTLSIDAAEGITTGISAADRALAITKAVAADALEGDDDDGLGFEDAVRQPRHEALVLLAPQGREGEPLELAAVDGAEPRAGEPEDEADDETQD